MPTINSPSVMRGQVSTRYLLFCLHGRNKILRTRSPFRNSSERVSERHVQEMHAFPVQNVDRACKGCRDRWNKDRIAPIFELFDDKSRNQGFLNLNERGLPDSLVTRPGQLLGETPD